MENTTTALVSLDHDINDIAADTDMARMDNDVAEIEEHNDSMIYDLTAFVAALEDFSAAVNEAVCQYACRCGREKKGGRGDRGHTG